MSLNRAPREAQLDHIDSLVNAYAALAGYLNRVQDLEIAISAAYREALSGNATYYHFPSILGPYAKPSELNISKAAWIAQHVLGLRAFCVGNRIVTLRDKQFGSPLVEQIAELGLRPKTVKYDAILPLVQPFGPQQRLDALFVDLALNVVFPLKAVWVASGNARIRQIPGPSLFPPKVWVERIDIQRSPLASLILTQWILSVAFPGMTVRPLLMVIDSEGWNYQIHETRDLCLRQISLDRFALDQIPPLTSSVDWLKGKRDLDELQRIPEIPAKNRLNRLPVDRATRSYMILDYLWELQKDADRLVVVDVPEIAGAIRQRHLIVYPIDLRRHDIEDCLARGGFVERTRYDGSGYALAPSGVARAVIMRQQLNQPGPYVMDVEDAEPHLLSPIRHQARLWAAYKNGDRVL